MLLTLLATERRLNVMDDVRDTRDAAEAVATPRSDAMRSEADGGSGAGCCSSREPRARLRVREAMLPAFEVGVLLSCNYRHHHDQQQQRHPANG